MSGRPSGPFQLCSPTGPRQPWESGHRPRRRRRSAVCRPDLERPPHCPLLLPSLEGRTEPCLRQQLWRDPEWEAAFQGSSHGGHPFPSSCPSTAAHCAPLSAQGLGTHLQSFSIYLPSLKTPSSRKSWGEAAVKSVLSSVRILSLFSSSSHPHWQTGV